MKRRWFIIAGAGLLGAGLIIGLVVVLGGPKTTDTKASKTAILTVAKGNLEVKTTATGKIEPVRITTIRPNPNLPTRTITAILVKNGDRVRAGQVLAQVDASGLDLDRDGALANWQAQKARLDGMQVGTKPDALVQAESNLTQAKIDAEQARLNVERNRVLFEKGIITQQNWEALGNTYSQAQAKVVASQSAYDSARAGTAKAEIQAQQSTMAEAQSSYQKTQLILESTLIRSPVDGVVTEVNQVVGDLASSGTAMFTVSDTATMVLRGYVDEVDVGAVKAGQTVALTFDGLPDRKFSGTVSEIYKKSTVTQNVTMFTVMVAVPNPDGKLLWGMSGTAEITTTDLRGILTVPTAALKTSAGRYQVVVVDGENQYLWDVKTGAADATTTQIVAGLNEGDRILAVAPRTTEAKTGQTQSVNQPGLPGGNILRTIR